MTLGTGILGCSQTPAPDVSAKNDNVNDKSVENVGQTQDELVLPSNRRLLGYYAQWAIYGGHGTYNPCMVPFTKYTHINYAFVGTRTAANPSYNLGTFSATANPYSGTGAVVRDTSNYDAHFKWLKGLDYHADEGHTNCSNGTFTDGHAVGPISYGGTYGGNVGLLRRAKEVYSDLKFIISFGGWTKGAGFPGVAADATKRGEFCDDVVRMVRRFSADGADFDWEFPGSSRQPDPSDSNDEGMPNGSSADVANFTSLLSTCRSKLDAAGTADGRTYDLTIAASAGKPNMDNIQWSSISSYVNMVNLMTYDFHGAWETMTGHQASLYANPNDGFAAPLKTQYNTDWAFRYLTGAGGAPPEGTKSFPASKVSIGMAFYTRGWAGVSGGIDVDGGGADGLYGSGNSTLAGDWGPGGQNGLGKIYDLKAAGGWKEIWDNSAKAHFLYNSSLGQLYTYDSVQSIEEKTNYCISKNCGGMMNWIIDGDKAVGGQSYPLISRAAELLASGSCVPSNSCQTNSCGTVSNGCGGNLNCGTCATGLTCKNNQCVTSCTATTCSAAGAQCGTISDGCTGTLDCGTCTTSGTSCNTSHQCVSTGSQSPYQIVNVNSAPVTIQAENYDLGGEGIAYHDTTTGNNWPGTFRSDDVDIQPTTDTDLGYNIGNTAAGEWLEYTVNVQTAAAYSFDLRLSNNNSGTTPTVKVYVDGTLAGSTTQGYTGGWQSWATATIAGPSIAAGSRVIKIELTNGGLNFNWFKIRQTSDTTAPSTPASPTTSGVTASSVNMSWTASTDNIAVAGYRLYRNGLQVGTVTSGTSYTFSGLQPDSTYVLGVSAYDAAGNNSSTATAANVTTSPTCSGIRVYQNSSYGGYGVCLQTGDYNAAALLARGIKDNDVTSLKVLTGYTVTLYDLDNFGMSTGSALVKTVDDSTLTDDVLGTGNWNDKVSSLKVTTVGADTTPPTVPTALSIGTVTTTQIPLSWTASTDNVNVTGYDLYRNGTLVASVGAVTSYTFTGLTAATGYTLGVRAKDGSNNFSAIATKAATTSGSTSGNCGAAAWSGSTNYSNGSIVVSTCAWSALCTAGDLNKNFAWQCIGNPTSFCSSFQPGAVNSNWSGIWNKLEQCP
jgi:chitinase